MLAYCIDVDDIQKEVDQVEERMITEESEGLIDRLTPLARLLEYIYKLDLEENSNLIILI